MNNQLTYFIYVRKSLEAEDRQVQSIEDQLTRLREIAAARGLKVAREFQEAKSARKPNNRPVFSDMVAAVRRGEANGLLCWQLNRLSRNPVESGELAWLLQSGAIRSIITADREHKSEDNALILSVETGMANQFVLELSRNVKRGIQGKLDRGELPGKAPVGYLNDPLKKMVVPDPDRFDTIREMWKLMLTGNYSVAQLVRRLNDDWGFTTPKRARSGGTPLATSAAYKLFANPFYAGLILRGGRTYVGKQTPMITVEEYDRVQSLLGKRDVPRPSKHVFTFSRLFRCAECECIVTAEHRTKYIKSKATNHFYTYYHCTRRKRQVDCSQRACLTEDELTRRLVRALHKFSVPKAFCDWTVRVLKDEASLDQARAERETDRLAAERMAVQGQLSRLTDLRVRDLIDDAEFVSQRQSLHGHLSRLDITSKEVNRPGRTIEALEKAFENVADISRRFGKAMMEQQRNYLREVSSNRRILHGNPRLQPVPWLLPIVKYRKRWRAEFRRFELMRKADLPTTKAAFAAQFPVWSGIVDEVCNRLLTSLSYLDEDNADAITSNGV